MKYNVVSIFSIFIVIFMISCNPVPTTSNQATPLSEQQRNKLEDILNGASVQTNDSTSNPSERFITRIDADQANPLGMASIDLAINEGEKGKMWTVGVQVVRRGAPVEVSASSFGSGTTSIPFNWFRGKLGKSGVFADVSQPMPFVASMNEDKWPNDPAVIFNNSKNSTKVDIYYHHMILNTHKEGAMRGRGSLNLGSIWRGTDFEAGDDVDLVIHLYSAGLGQTFEWYEAYIESRIYANLVDVLITKKLTLDTIIGEIMSQVTVGDVIELQRIPLVLE
jgi:hypothetical protein